MKKGFCKVCGMAINEKNFAINNNALPEVNSEEHLLYCPFCGAHKRYFCEDRDEIYTTVGVKLTDEELKILDHATKLEIFNGDFYMEASRRAVKEENKLMFKELGNIEYIHAKVHMKIAGIKEKPELRKIDYSRLKNDEDFIREANTREKHAVSFYNKGVVNSENSIVKEVLKAFMEIEEDHIHMTE
ncbi:metal-iron-binding protein [Oceanirhabdus sp. W0125-5]|uniref:metal-iron-binding protein n=1 Tax=Oceanirhabdus sp. W0125-5 TaxID=2999116 RepID=UPI0022F2EBC4|nr:metal-iron-binding protein [Oceanirhabdus sp. W0125-5]WBW96024.1 metal-iron-binding protein [Oceanirhabdus sp. W0125-5]